MTRMTNETMESTVTFSGREHYSDDARAVLRALEARLEDVLADVYRMTGWKQITHPSAPRALVRATLREVFRGVYWYQRHTTEAGFLMLGRLPKSEVKIMKALLLHKHEEALHGEWALRDYLALGGTTEGAMEPPSPATFAVAAVWWRMAQTELPLGYLGAEYLFECLTMRVTQPLLAALRGHEVPEAEIGFLVEHATEDIKHTNLIAHWILDSATRYPDSAESMLRCFDYFRAVYPLPVWQEAFDRAQNAVSEGDGNDECYDSDLDRAPQTVLHVR
jgi:hypothetical protein